MGREALQAMLALGGLSTVLGPASESPDVSIQPLAVDPSLVLVSSVDVFTAISGDPYNQGFIACANALSDVYAVGVTEVDSILMIAGVCTRIPELFRDVVYSELFRGFVACCTAAGSRCHGGQTIFTAEVLLGGSISAVIPRSSLLSIKAAVADDILILTKPLGTQLAANLAIWVRDEALWQTKLAQSPDFAKFDAIAVVQAAETSMMRLNRQAALAAKLAQSHASTDVTGFGLLGHARNLLEVQTAHVDFVITRLPVFRGLLKLNFALLDRVKSGLAPETSGGLLLALAPAKLAEFAAGMGNEPFWVIGRVEVARAPTREVRFAQGGAEIFEI